MDICSDRYLFVVGNSRSGTTMMLRMINNHKDIYCLNELHFFENLWSSKDKEKPISKEEAIALIAKLYFIQHDGYIGKTDHKKYHKVAEKIYNQYLSNSTQLLPHHVYATYMQYETAANKKHIACEKTPQNVFYIQDILELFPNARILNMVRDPRAVMLSQKNKWKRRKMGASFITPWEVLRLRINYHPITIAKLWNAAIKATSKFAKDKRVKTIHFEDILFNSEQTLKEVCNHFEVAYDENMLQIPHASSSNMADSNKKGINAKNASRWQNGGLSNAEIVICEKIAEEQIKDNNYELLKPKANPISILLYYLIWPAKIGLALMFNFSRMKNIKETIKKRLNK